MVRKQQAGFYPQGRAFRVWKPLPRTLFLTSFEGVSDRALRTSSPNVDIETCSDLQNSQVPPLYFAWFRGQEISMLGIRDIARADPIFAIFGSFCLAGAPQNCWDQGCRPSHCVCTTPVGHPKHLAFMGVSGEAVRGNPILASYNRVEYLKVLPAVWMRFG